MTNATQHKRREAKAARRRKRLDTGNRPRRQDMTALKDRGAERMSEALATLPRGFGAAKRSGTSPDALVERVLDLVKRKGRVAA